MFTGLLLKESLKNTNFLLDHRITITKEETWRVGKRAVDWQPKIWTAVYITGNDTDLEDIAATISAAILDKWYANLSDSTTEHVIFHNKIFSYPKEDKAAKQKAWDYGKSLGVPEHQLDW